MESSFIKRPACIVKDVNFLASNNLERNSGETDEEGDGGVSTSGPCTCSKCGQVFTNEPEAMMHKEQCSAYDWSERFVDRAARQLMNTIEKGEIEIHVSPSENRDLENLVVSTHIRRTQLFSEFWAVRPGKGSKLGKNYVQPYKEHIKKWVEDGEKDKSKRLCAVRVQEQLRVMFPTRYDIPATHHIHNYMNVVISAIRAEEQANKSDAQISSKKPPRKTRYCMPPQYAEEMEEIVRKNKRIQHIQREKELLAVLNISADSKPDDVTDLERVRTKMYSLKHKIRNQRGAA